MQVAGGRGGGGGFDTLCSALTLVPVRERRLANEPTDTLAHGVGQPAAYTGMVRSAFRPSDDACTFPYLVPANGMNALLFALVRVACAPGYCIYTAPSSVWWSERVRTLYSSSLVYEGQRVEGAHTRMLDIRKPMS